MSINGITQDDVDEFNTIPFTNNALDMYQRIATKSAMYPGKGSSLGLMYCAIKLTGEAGEFSEHVGKAMRDDNLTPITASMGGDYVLLTGNLKPERHELLVKEAGDVLWYLSAICNELGITLSEAAATNLGKLKDRTARNKLQGSGDNR